MAPIKTTSAFSTEHTLIGPGQSTQVSGREAFVTGRAPCCGWIQRDTKATGSIIKLAATANSSTPMATSMTELG